MSQLQPFTADQLNKYTTWFASADPPVASDFGTLWFQAEAHLETAYSNGQSIVNLPDFSGVAGPATEYQAGHAATWRVADMNGRPAYRFDQLPSAADPTKAYNIPSMTAFPGANGVTAVAVLINRPDGLLPETQSNGLWYMRSSNTGWPRRIAGRPPAQDIVIGFGRSDNLIVPQSSYLYDLRNVSILVANCNSTSSDFWLNNYYLGQVDTGTLGWTASSARFGIAGSLSSSNKFRGSLGSLLIYSPQLTATNRNACVAAYRDYFSIPFNFHNP